MSKFNLTAQIQLQAPKNAAQVVNQIQRQLSGVNVNVNVKGGPQATKQVQNLTKATNQAATASERLGKTITVSIKRYAGMAIATRAVSLFTNTLGNAIQEAIDFERELIKVVQVTGRSIQSLRGLTNEITRLSTAFGASSTSLINVSRILSQAGLSAQETKTALDALARSTLAPTFDDITQTAEGAVAIFNQFQQGAAALEKQLGAINAVAGKFAVEAGDLISVIRRTGGVFKAAGGDLNELIALFTSVRATTRESAESIATGLRTIFTRIQRPKTIEFMKQFGVQLTDLEGKFVGPFEAVKRLSAALAGLEQGDLQFIAIAEELGGFRQIGKVIPLIQQFQISQQALNEAIKGGDSLTKDAATAQLALAVRISKVKEEFLALIRAITESKSFQLFANTALNIASALIKVADALKPIIPLITAFAAVKFAKGIGGVLGGIKGFNRGGIVPGSGNRDTVPAMLTPGEFVIRKSSVAKLGADNLEAMNNNRYALGGPITRTKPLGMLVRKEGEDPSDFTGEMPLKSIRRGTQAIKELQQLQAEQGLNIQLRSKVATSAFNKSDQFTKAAETPILNSIDEAAASLTESSGGTKVSGDDAKNKAKAALGQLFEDFITSVGSLDKPGTANFDLIGAEKRLKPHTKEDIKQYTDIKLNANQANADNIIKKAANQGLYDSAARRRITAIGQQEGFASGGAVGTDTVPALLTPGEFVVNRASAQKIGYDSLNRMNKVGKYAAGGVVTPNRHFYGNGPMGSPGSIPGMKVSSKVSKPANTAPQKDAAKATEDMSTKMLLASAALQAMIPAIDENSSASQKAVAKLATFATTILTVTSALQAFGVKLSLQNLSGKGIKRATTKGLGRVGSRLRGVGQGMQGGNFPTLGKGIGKVGNLFSKLAPKLGSFAGAIAGPALGLTALFGGISAVVSGFNDFEGQLNDAIKANDVAKAQQMSLANANEKAIPIVGGLVSGLFEAAGASDTLTGILSTVGGPTAASLEAGVKAQIKANQATKAMGDAAKVASTAMEDLKNGTITAAEGLERIQAAQSAQRASRRAATEFAQANVENRSTGAGAVTRNILTLGGLLGETSSQRNRRLSEESASGIRTETQRQAEAFQQQSAMRNASIRSVFARGGTREQAAEAAGINEMRQDQRRTEREAQRLALAGDEQGAKALFDQAKQIGEQIEQTEKSLDNIGDASDRARAAIEAMSLGMGNATAAATAASVGLETMLASSKNGFNPLEVAITTLQASVTAAARGMDADDLAAASQTAADALKALDADADVSKFQQNIKAVQEAQRALPSALKGVQNILLDQEGAGLTADMTPQAIKDNLADAIGRSLEGDASISKEAREGLVAQIKNMDIDEDELNRIMQEGDVDALSKILGDIGDAALSQILPALQEQAKFQNQINQLTQQRIALENTFIDAQKKAIDTQLEVADILAKHGGPAVTAEQRTNALIQQGNIDSSRLGGVQALQTGSAAEFRARALQSRDRLNQLQNAEAVGNQAGIERNAEIERLKQFQQQEADRIKQGIAAREKELELIKTRNAEEKKGLEALLEGDFEAFFDSQAATGATAALATGNVQAAQMFGTAGLAGAFQNLQGMQEAGVNTVFGQQIGGQGGLLERSAGAALGQFGMAGSAGILAGTDPESEAIRAEITELAPVLNELAQTTTMAANNDLLAADKQMEAAQKQFDAATQRVAEAKAAAPPPPPPVERALGGMIYANRGMFVPRGTDTVPAMLTPGEFVVRRSAVQRGNNLQLLKAINSGGASAQGGAQGLSRGGSVNYLANGGEASGGGFGLSTEVLNNFASALNNFNTQLAEHIQNLQNIQLQVTLAPTNVNVNLTGTSFLESLTTTLKSELMNFVSDEIRSHSVGAGGKLTKDTMGV